MKNIYLRRINALQAKLEFKKNTELWRSTSNISLECWNTSTSRVKNNAEKLNKDLFKNINDISWNHYTWYKEYSN